MTNIVISLNDHRVGVPMLLTASSSLSGQVLLSLTKSKKVNYLRIQLRVESESTVRYRDGNHYKTDTNIRRQADDSIPLINVTPGKVLQLSAGSHAYPFSFPMNNRNLPSSYEYSSENYVRWTLNVAADFKGHIFDKKYFVEVLVDFPRLVVAPRYLKPMSLDDEKTVCCLFCADGPIILHGSINRTGVARGSYIDIHAKCDNISSRTVRLACKLIRKVRMGIEHEDIKRITVIERLGPAISPRQREIDWKIKFEIPPHMKPATIDQPSNFSVTYYLQAEARIPKALDLELRFPITIGAGRMQVERGIEPYAM